MVKLQIYYRVICRLNLIVRIHLVILVTYSSISVVPRYNPWNVNTFLFNISNKDNINNQYATKCGYNMHTCNYVEQECVRTKFKNKLNILERYQIIIFYLLTHSRTYFSSTYELPASTSKESHDKIDDILDIKTKCDTLLKEYKEL